VEDCSQSCDRDLKWRPPDTRQERHDKHCMWSWVFIFTPSNGSALCSADVRRDNTETTLIVCRRAANIVRQVRQQHLLILCWKICELYKTVTPQGVSRAQYRQRSRRCWTRDRNCCYDRRAGLQNMWLILRSRLCLLRWEQTGRLASYIPAAR